MVAGCSTFASRQQLSRLKRDLSKARTCAQMKLGESALWEVWFMQRSEKWTWRLMKLSLFKHQAIKSPGIWLVLSEFSSSYRRRRIQKLSLGSPMCMENFYFIFIFLLIAHEPVLRDVRRKYIIRPLNFFPDAMASWDVGLTNRCPGGPGLGRNQFQEQCLYSEGTELSSPVILISKDQFIN